MAGFSEKTKDLQFLHHVKGFSAVSITRIGPASTVPHVGLMPVPFAFTYLPYTKEKVGYSRQKCVREQMKA
jgi:hypothetical protein